jgi:hypothetical protein
MVAKTIDVGKKYGSRVRNTKISKHSDLAGLPGIKKTTSVIRKHIRTISNCRPVKLRRTPLRKNSRSGPLHKSYISLIQGSSRANSVPIGFDHGIKGKDIASLRACHIKIVPFFFVFLTFDFFIHHT